MPRVNTHLQLSGGCVILSKPYFSCIIFMACFAQVLADVKEKVVVGNI